MHYWMYYRSLWISRNIRKVPNFGGYHFDFPKDKEFHIKRLRFSYSQYTIPSESIVQEKS